MVRPDSYVKVLDLGLARRTIVEAGQQNISSTAGLPVGTLRYMSPEQCRGETATPASDVFAAGVVLFEMLAGRHPFHADSPLDTAHAIAWSDPPALTQVNPDVPRPVSSLIMRMLSKDAQARPSATEVAEALAGLGAPVAPQASRRFPVVPVSLAALAIILVWGISVSRPGRIHSSLSDLRVSPLASLLGAERQPSFSPDGARVAFAFAGEKDATSHIYIKSIPDGALNRVTSDALADFQPVFSPDGTKLAFLRRADGRLRVMVIPPAGGIERQVGELMDFLYEYELLAWDAEGRSLIVADLPASPHRVSLFQLSIDTGARRQITFPPDGTSDWMPAVSPDGRTLVFARLFGTGDGDLWSMPLAGGPLRRVTSANGVFFCWSWGPGGRDLLIGYRRSGRIHLWRQPVNGGPQVRVAGLDDQVMELSVARTGNRIVYGAGNNEDYNVWRYALPPSKAPAKSLIASAAFDGDARYSPDGEHIAFASTRSGQSDIWICSSDGSDVKQMTSLGPGEFARSPNWSPDGRWIAFTSNSAKSEDSVFLLDVLGGKPRRLTGPGPSDIIPSWSRDSRWVYFSSDRGGGDLQIWKEPAGGGSPVQVTRNGGLEIFESPDGRFLYYTKADRKGGFWRMPLAGGDETFVPGLEAVSIRYWENSPRGIYFVAPSKTPALELFRFLDGKVTRVLALPTPPSKGHQGISVSPDGRSLLYMQADVATSNLMVVNDFR